MTSQNMTVTLRNTGEDAFKPDVYGQSLTFQRTITENGTSSYLLKVKVILVIIINESMILS